MWPLGAHLWFFEQRRTTILRKPLRQRGLLPHGVPFTTGAETQPSVRCIARSTSWIVHGATHACNK